MRLAILFGSLALAATALPVHAQVEASGSLTSLPSVDSRAVVAEVRRVIGERYVLPERRPALDAVMAEGLASGRYAVTDGAVLAERLNADLERVGQDRHLGFRFNPQEAAMIASGSVEQPGANPAFERLIRNANHGVTDLRLLPGNVRLMKYDGFHWTGAESAAALDNAMRFLAGGDAVIIDLRANGGGNPSFSDISGAAAAINELFDDCRIFDASPAPGYSSKAVSPASATAQRLSAEDAPDEAGKLTAFPNPFTTATLLTFALPETAKYTLTVYDLKGSVAARVSSSEAQAGVRYRFAVGAGLQEGVYVARLVTATGTQTIRLNLLH